MYIYGLDTETVKGEPLTFQFSDGKQDKIFFVNQNNITRRFLDLLESSKKGHADKSVIYVLNLLFDFLILFYPHWQDIVKQEKENGKFEIDIDGWNINGFITEDSQFVELRRKKQVFWMVDIGRFFIGISLEKAIQKLLKDKGKRNKPKGLGKIKYKKQHKEFIKYALWDSHETQRIGELITKFHTDWNVTQTWSIAQLAERIFRHHFLKENIKGTPYEIIRPALCSYHGGRNGFYEKPGMFKTCYSYDIVSAYPFAMVNLPNFQGAEYYEVKKYEPGYVGIYRVSGKKLNCKYPAFFTHDFKEINGNFEDIWITGYEYEQALKWKEAKFDEVKGYILYPTKFEKTALQDYVEAFVKLKTETDKEHPYYEFYKRLLNALYGKFIQMREETLEDDTKRWITGQMFHPFIASSITGFVRAMIHNFEHNFNSIHTSTDSIKTLKPIPEKYLSKELGGLSLEVKGKALIIRSRLYLHWNEQGELKKFALHGFRGKPQDLLDLWKEKRKNYKAVRMVKPKEAIVQNKKPFVFEEQDIILNY